jgi:hypothetical protein
MFKVSLKVFFAGDFCGVLLSSSTVLRSFGAGMGSEHQETLGDMCWRAITRILAQNVHFCRPIASHEAHKQYHVIRSQIVAFANRWRNTILDWYIIGALGFQRDNTRLIRPVMCLLINWSTHAQPCFTQSDESEESERRRITNSTPGTATA